MSKISITQYDHFSRASFWCPFRSSSSFIYCKWTNCVTKIKIASISIRWSTNRPWKGVVIRWMVGQRGGGGSKAMLSLSADLIKGSCWSVPRRSPLMVTSRSSYVFSRLSIGNKWVIQLTQHVCYLFQKFKSYLGLANAHGNRLTAPTFTRAHQVWEVMSSFVKLHFKLEGGEQFASHNTSSTYNHNLAHWLLSPSNRPASRQAIALVISNTVSCDLFFSSSARFLFLHSSRSRHRPDVLHW